MDQTYPWQVALRHVFSPYDCLLISDAFVVLCRVGCLCITGVSLTFRINEYTAANFCHFYSLPSARKPFRIEVNFKRKQLVAI